MEFSRPARIKVWYFGGDKRITRTFTTNSFKTAVKRFIGNDPLVTYIGKASTSIHAFVDIQTGKEYRASMIVNK